MTSPVDEDVDVAVERRRVLRGSGKRDLIRLENLTQVKKIVLLLTGETLNPHHISYLYLLLSCDF